MEKLGIIAGNGDYPLLVAQGARKSGVKRIVVAALIGETKREIEAYSDVVCWIEVGQLGKLISFFKKNDITNVIMAGQVTPTRLFGRLKLDLRMVKLLAKIKMRGAEPIFSTIASELSSFGINLIDSSMFMKEQLAHEGIMSGGRIARKFLKDIKFGIGIAKAIANMDIGQTVVVKDKTIVAVEGIEGTDATIERAGELAGKDCVVIKVSKKNQDMRFDLPVIGMKTINIMEKTKARVLAVEAAKTIILNKSSVLEKANELGIIIYGFSEKDS